MGLRAAYGLYIQIQYLQWKLINSPKQNFHSFLNISFFFFFFSLLFFIFQVDMFKQNTFSSECVEIYRSLKSFMLTAIPFFFTLHSFHTNFFYNDSAVVQNSQTTSTDSVCHDFYGSILLSASQNIIHYLAALIKKFCGFPQLFCEVQRRECSET